MDVAKEVIADTVRHYRMTETEDWAQRFHGIADPVIEAFPADFRTHDVYFDGAAKLLFRSANSDDRFVMAHIFGRCDGRRAVIDRVVIPDTAETPVH